MIEVEAKVFVKNLKDARKKARVLGKFTRKEKKVDDYYTLEDLNSYPKKSLRIRKIDGYSIVNFKKRLSYKKGIWAKKEVEFKTSNINDFLKLIGDFGFRKWLTKEKECEIYKIEPNFQIELNKVRDLGWFMEIEYLVESKNDIRAARDEVIKILGKMGYKPGDSIKTGYTKQLWDKKHR
jgi:adenylate cyclase class 2